MWQKRNSVVNFYRICLTRLAILNSLSPNNVKMTRDFVRRTGIAFASAAMLAAGCAAVESKPDVEVVKERAQARWNALVSGDVKTAYGYLSPATRATLTPEAYESSVRKGFWKSVVVDKVYCESPTVCAADLTVEYEYLGRRTKTPLKDNWIKDGSTWWYVQK